MTAALESEGKAAAAKRPPTKRPIKTLSQQQQLDAAKLNEERNLAELEQWKEEVTRGRGFLPCAATGELRKTCTQIRFMLRRA